MLSIKSYPAVGIPRSTRQIEIDLLGWNLQIVIGVTLSHISEWTSEEVSQGREASERSEDREP